MLEGLSTNRHCDATADCLVSEGKTFVFRYHSRTTQQPQKRLHPREAAELARAGLSVACVYQDRGRQVEDFGSARGEEDATSALTFAGQVGQPPGSAVYFAVDEDLSQAQIQSAVLPYFRSVERTFKAAGQGTAYLKIGVYGSGLSCRLVRGLGFVSFTWLAEATGWRESNLFTGWDVKQHRNTGQTLCALGELFQRCEAHNSFGQFQPVGFELSGGQGERRRIKAEGGNLRHLPSTSFNEPITLLPQGHELRVLGTSAPGWVRVRTNLGGGEVIGHVALSRLEAAVDVPPAPTPAPSPTPAPPPPALPALPALPFAHLRENNTCATRQSMNHRAFPIGEASRPQRDAHATPEERIAQLRAIGDWLAVESSPRYARTPGATFCNIYAHDHCYLSGVYLPRVWWTGPALLRIGQGETVDALYADTVREMRADDLFAWLVDMGPRLGWQRVFDASALQAAANHGGVGVICADRAAEGRPGHITVVVPEDDVHRATRDADGHVTQPLQSQAGAVNKRFGSAGPNWWMGSEFRDRGFFIHA